MVYIVTDGSGCVKIGVAKRLDKRIKQLQSGNPRELSVLMTLDTGMIENDELLEKILHHLFAGQKVEIKGAREWFYERAYDSLKFETRRVVTRACEIGGIRSKVKCNMGNISFIIDTKDRTNKFKSSLSDVDLYGEKS